MADTLPAPLPRATSDDNKIIEEYADGCGTSSVSAPWVIAPTKRIITYQMQIVQQPINAKACDIGGKRWCILPIPIILASLNTPLVVKLNIFELDCGNQIYTDITPTHRGTFLLYATLERAQPTLQIADRCLSDLSSPPSLASVHVAEIAYLNRPVQSGYFVLSDLSIAFEGCYILTLDLYERIRNSERDVTESITPAKASIHYRNPSVPSSLHFRLRVKSELYNVFRPISFSEIAQCMSMDCIITDQSPCVWVRRDARMRRRYDEPNERIRLREDSMQ
ncbi:Velvet factor [Penicillium angulare]|uniref:Velvet factor n=1 Tax=Penicillium angulare TaxID=116970 RepID=UPI002541F985|nr:Velvet factor [Penicillium angulare]KAJ5288033.1 Velvet factor [Penicillium angulare]